MMYVYLSVYIQYNIIFMYFGFCAYFSDISEQYVYYEINTLKYK